MIDIEKTIISTLTDKINNLRFLSQNDTKAFKKILTLIILDDLFKWSCWFKTKDLSVLKYLFRLRNKYILCNPIFNVILQKTTYTDENGDIQINYMLEPYTNVNLPQTNYDYERIWDQLNNVITLQDIIQPYDPKEIPDPWKPDPTCPVSIVYFGEGTTIAAKGEKRDGEPDININSLTICEKMNIYINRKTGKMYYLDPETCKWEALKGELSAAVKWSNIEDAPAIYSGIEHIVDSNKEVLNVHLNESKYDKNTGTWSPVSHTSDVSVTDCSSDPDANKDLKDIL